ncbi:MAG: hypothetical protein ACT4OU_00935 [Hyphomicrobium sp.]
MTALTLESRGSARQTWPVAQFANAAAGFAAIGLLVLAAAAPDERDIAQSTAIDGASDALYGPRRETTFGAYLGAPYHYPSDFILKQEGRHDLRIKNVEWYTRPFDNPLYYGARIQRWGEGGRFGTMLDFTHSKAYAPMEGENVFEGQIDGQPAPSKGVIQDYFKRLEWSHGHNMLTLNGLVRLATIGRISAYAGAGAGVSLPHSEIHVASDPARTYEYQYAGPTAQALFGVEFRTKTGTVFVEYKFTFADYWGPITHRDGAILPIDLWRQFSRWWSGEPPPGGFAGARLSSHNAISGFTFRFSPTASP